jgi:hypothetical protein
MKTSDNVSAIAAALVKAQAVMHGAAKDGVNPQFRTSATGGRYATLAAVIDACRKPLTDHGIAFLQAPGAICDFGIPITTTLVHTSGEWITNTLVMPVDKRTAQGVGSAITYGCRYALMAMVGLPPVDDDDGNAATEKADVPKERPSPQVPSPPVPAQRADTPSPPPSEGTIARALMMSLKSARTEPDLGRWLQDNQDVIDALPDVLKEEVRAAYRVKLLSLRRAA